MTTRVEVVADDLWPSQVARDLEKAATPGTRLCLATGATLAPVFHLVHGLTGAIILLLDEFGGLPPGDPGRCLSMLQRDLLDHLDSPPHVEVPDVDSADPDVAAARYREIVSNGIDLAVVGLGLNGHIGMNEPGTAIDAATRVVDLAAETSANAASYGASVPTTWGITVGFAELMTAGEVWLVVTGAHKREILSRILTDPVGPNLPATYLRKHHNLRVIVDRSAHGE